MNARPAGELPEEFWPLLERYGNLPVPPSADWWPTQAQTKAYILCQYLAAGLAIFPCYYVLLDGRCSCRKAACDRIGKHPQPPNGLHAASTDPEKVLRYHQAVPDSNWAMAAGEVSGCDVLDGDPRHGGMQTISRLEEELGFPSNFERTWIAISGGGGPHYFFQHYAGMRNSVGEQGRGLGPGVDVRGDGGYVLLSPSNHKDNLTFGAYSWLIEPWAGPLAPWPEELARRALAPKPSALPVCRPASGYLEERGAEVPPGLLRYAKEGKPEGERDNAGFWLACRLREEVRDDQLAYSVLEDYAYNCNPPLTESDVRRIWTSACTRASYSPGARAVSISQATVRSL